MGLVSNAFTNSAISSGSFDGSSRRNRRPLTESAVGSRENHNIAASNRRRNTGARRCSRRTSRTGATRSAIATRRTRTRSPDAGGNPGANTSLYRRPSGRGNTGARRCARRTTATSTRSTNPSCTGHGRTGTSRTNTPEPSKHLRPHRTAQPRIQHNPQRLPPLKPSQPHIQLRIIRQHRPNTSHHSRAARAPALNVSAGGFAGDPLAGAVGQAPCGHPGSSRV